MDEPKDDLTPGVSEEEFPDWPEDAPGDDEWTEADEQALAGADAGMFISHEAMKRWFDDIAKGIRRPPPQVGE